jgi:hypothetical protein
MKSENARVDAMNVTKNTDACPTLPSESHATEDEFIRFDRFWKHLSKWKL